MFEEKRRKLGIAMTRFLTRTKEAKPMSFSNSFTNAKTALVIIPENSEQRSVVAQMLILLQNKFQGNKLTFVVHEGYRNFSNTLNSSNVTTIKNEYLNFFFLPKKTKLSKLLEQNFDIVIDLNLSLVPSAAFLCRHIKSPLKVGFSQKHADAYYNFQFNAAQNRNPKNKYDQLFRTLSMF